MLEDLGGELRRRQDKVDQAGGNGAARHRLKFCLLGTLHHDHPAVLLDGLYAQGAVRAAAGKQDASAVGMSLGQGAKKHVNRSPAPARRFKIGDHQVAVGDPEVLAWVG